MSKFSLIEITERANWDALFYQIDRSPLIQGWSYGDAVQNSTGRKPGRYGVFDQDRCLAIVQVRKHRFFSRVNRGPLWLTNEMTERTQVLSLLANHFRLIVWAPNEISGAKMNGPGFTVKLRRDAWQSMWLNLRLSEVELSKNLQGKWRNQLNQSYRLAPEAVVSVAQAGDWEWFCEEYRKLQELKIFAGVPIEILDHYRLHTNDFIQLVVKNKSEVVASGVFVRHGQSATYLAGVNTDKGRKIYAHNRMLWFACQLLAKENVRSFDLGGLDFVHTPGVAHFKAGMGGESYELAGEFVRAAFF